MHPNRKFHIEDREEMASVLLDGERLRFHVSRGNLVHPALLAGAQALFVATGPHAYISPDHYGLEDRVPTWNYVAVELEGPVSALDSDALIRLVDDLSAEHEARLAPKPPWTRERMSEGRFDGLVKAITGFEMRIAAWRGTAKVDQDKPAEVRTRIGRALAEAGQHEMAEIMMRTSP